MGHRVLTATVLLAACSTTDPVVNALIPASGAAGSVVRVELDTTDCAPQFDFDRARRTADSTLQAHVGDLVLSAHRDGDERFAVELPATLPAGTYPVSLDLGDGRTARSQASYTALAPDLVVTDVHSTTDHVTAGDTGVPLVFVLDATGACGVTGARVVPRFVRGGVDISDMLAVHGAGVTDVPAHARAELAFVVDFPTDSPRGEITVTGSLAGGTRVGNGCSGPALTGDTSTPWSWTVEPQAIAGLVVLRLSAANRAPTAGASTEVTAAVLNVGLSDVTITGVRLASFPEGALRLPSNGPLPIGQTIAARQQLTFDTEVRVSDSVLAGTTVSFAMVVTGVGPGGAVYTTSPQAVVATVVVAP